jgi:hypothetical protein
MFSNRPGGHPAAVVDGRKTDPPPAQSEIAHPIEGVTHRSGWPHEFHRIKSEAPLRHPPDGLVAQISPNQERSTAAPHPKRVDR